MLVSQIMKCLIVTGALLFSSCGAATTKVKGEETKIAGLDAENKEGESTGTDGESLSKLDREKESRTVHNVSPVSFSSTEDYLIFSKNISENWTLFHALRPRDNAWSNSLNPKENTSDDEDLVLIRGLIARNGKFLILFGEKDSKMYAYKLHGEHNKIVRV